MKHPWLSVLIPTYNGEAYLPMALDSVVDQGDTTIECVVVDDGSTDKTLSILESYQDKLKIRLFKKERQGSWVSSTNYAISFAQGEYISLLHQDDVWVKNRLKIMKGVIERFSNVDFFFHSASFIDEKNNNLGLWKCPISSFPTIIPPDLMIEKLLIQNFISTPAPIFKRDIALSVGMLNENLWYTADWDLWLKICSQGNSIYYPEPLSKFRIHIHSQTIKRSLHLDDFKEQLTSVLKNYLNHQGFSKKIGKNIYKIAIFSIEVNTALAGIFHGKKSNLANLTLGFLMLGPLGWARYLYNSRILERAMARLRAQLIFNN